MTSDLKIRITQHRVAQGECMDEMQWIFSPSEQEKAITSILSGLTDLGPSDTLIASLYDSPELCELAVSALMLFNAKNGDLEISQRLELLTPLRGSDQPESIRKRAGQQLASMASKGYT